jgi:hypothetical protein
MPSGIRETLNVNILDAVFATCPDADVQSRLEQ